MCSVRLAQVSAGIVFAALLSLSATKAWAAPTVVSIEPVSSPSSASTADFTVTFSEPVTGIDLNDFILTPDGVSAGIANVAGSGSFYTVTLMMISGSGTIRLDLKGSGTGITDAANNPIAGGFTAGAALTVIPATGSPTPVPTLSQWAMILFAALLSGGAALSVQRRRPVV